MVKYLKRCPISLIIKENQIKTTSREGINSLAAQWLELGTFTWRRQGGSIFGQGT